MLSRLHPLASDESGAVAVIIALLLPALLAFAAFGFGALLLTGGERELQRATDAAAVAAAASLKLVSLDGTSGAESIACQIIRDNLEPARIANAFAVGPVPDCDNGGVTVSTVAELASAGAIHSHLAALQDLLDGSITVTTTELVPECTIVLGIEVCVDVEATVETGITPPVDLSNLAPAVLTPRVRVSADHALATPLGELVGEDEDGSEVGASSLARRRIKNAVLLPVAACDEELEVVIVAGGVSLRQALEAHCMADPNVWAAAAGDAGFAALDELSQRLAALVPGQAEALCAVEWLNQDLTDLYNPPRTGHAPTAWDIIEAADPAEPVLVIASGVIGASAIPVFDMWAVPAGQLAEHNLAGAAVDLAAAEGIFRASLIDEAAAVRPGCAP